MGAPRKFQGACRSVILRGYLTAYLTTIRSLSLSSNSVAMQGFNQNRREKQFQSYYRESSFQFTTQEHSSSLHGSTPQFPEPQVSSPYAEIPTTYESLNTHHANTFAYQEQEATLGHFSPGYMPMPQIPGYTEQQYARDTSEFYSMPVPSFAVSNGHFPENPVSLEVETSNLHASTHLREGYIDQDAFAFENSPTSWPESMPSPWNSASKQPSNYSFPNTQSTFPHQNETMPMVEVGNHNHSPFPQDLSHSENELRNKWEPSSLLSSPSELGISTPLSANVYSPQSGLLAAISGAEHLKEPQSVPEVVRTHELPPTNAEEIKVPQQLNESVHLPPSSYTIPTKVEPLNDIVDDRPRPADHIQTQEILADNVLALESLKIDPPVAPCSQKENEQILNPEDKYRVIPDQSKPEGPFGEELPKTVQCLESDISQSQPTDPENPQDIEKDDRLYGDSDSEDEPEGPVLPLLFKAEDHLIISEYIAANELYTIYPPKFTNKTKLAVFNQFSSKTHQPGDWIVEISRWSPPKALPSRAFYQDAGYSLKIRLDEDYLTSPTDPKGCTWRVNFSNGQLLGNYGELEPSTGELQVLEYPLLGSVRELLLQRSKKLPNLAPQTFAAGSTDEMPCESTPILIQDIPQMCEFSIPEEPGSPHQPDQHKHLASLSTSKILKMFKPCTSTNRSNFISMASPPEGHNAYDIETIRTALTTAYCSFAAARYQSYQKCGYTPDYDDFPEEDANPSNRPYIIIHTGAWGAGRRGGNRVLMHLIQMLAARLAGVDRIVFHSCQKENTEAFLEAERLYDTVWSRFVSTPSENVESSDESSDSIVDIIVSLKEFLWQNSDPAEKKRSSKWFFGMWS
ncbi:hypothetical protein K493DRAFT_341000 [Basidiobolus meristosporus CBS 931.73]|uniref:PARG catalytic Macro domain-containing protein n=1 Tax=Basidiobolus meristosporus CBS 931.73 TaxID=1314790 RepID=A0A1Y1XUD1_9FUNG|nr:hypothetical protein K493DRAFT_341000 [Basidiobolus meristosporus CBS 931.73]|eukprot:ORX88894.1 hypothetical protein K493DRAFT_341000 [Basidiobolus meristosporus CBS 931.73]